MKIVVNLRVNVPSKFILHLSDPTREWTSGEDFFVGTEIDIMMGYKDDYSQVMKGHVTGLDPHWSQNGPSTVDIIGHCGLVNLNFAKTMRSFNNRTDPEIVQEIVELNGLEVGEIDDFGYEHKFISFQRLTDYEYLLQLAQKYDIYFWCEGRKFFCMKNPDRGDDEIILEAGKTLTQFKVDAESRMLASAYQVRSWDFKKWEAIVGDATCDDIEKLGGKEAGGTVVEENFGEAKTVVIDNSVPDQKTAEEIAQAMLSKEMSRYVTGEGVTEGNAKILAGTTVTIKEMGEKFSGKYFVKFVRHEFDVLKGFSTEFYVTRNALGKVKEGSTDDSGEKKAMASPGEKKQEERGHVGKDDKKPEFSNLKWVDEDGNDVSEAQVGDIVYAVADVKNLDGESVFVKILEKDEYDEDDPIDSFSTTVKDGKIKGKWKFRYVEDEDDVGSEEEKEEKGYTKPEFIFHITKGDDVTSVDSGELKYQDWVQFKIIDSSTGNPLKDVDYKITFADGSKIEGKVDKEGKIKIENFPPGKFSIQLGEDSFEYNVKKHDKSH